MRLWKKITELTVSSLLKLGKNALMQAVNPDNSEFYFTPTSETLIAAKVLTKKDLGKIFYLSLAAGFQVTLPAPVRSGRLRFVVATAPTGGAYTIVTSGSANIMKGGINELEVDTGDDGPSSTGADTLTFVANTAVVGDFVDFDSDGTSWFLRGQTAADGGATLAAT